MQKKYQIFISSTHTDLSEERRAVYEAIVRAGHIPIAMEFFGARTIASIELVKSSIDQSDFQITILGDRYGSMIDGVGYTEAEYDYAEDRHIPQIALVKRIPLYSADEPHQHHVALSRFREKVTAKGKQCAFWNDKADLVGLVQQSLINEIQDGNERPGWVRGDSTDEFLKRRVNALQEELRGVKEAFLRSRRNLNENNRLHFKNSVIGIPFVSGVWQCRTKALTMELFEFAGMVMSHFTTGTHEHLLHGLYSAAHKEFQYIAWRRDRDPDASGSFQETVMFGRIHSIRQDSFISEVFATDGKAELQVDFHERLSWYRISKASLADRPS